MYAIEAKMEALCDKLIEKGADINAKDKYVPPLSSIMHRSGLLKVSDVFFGCFSPRSIRDFTQGVSLLSLSPCSLTSGLLKVSDVFFGCFFPRSIRDFNRA